MCPSASSRSMIGRSTSTCAGALMSTQTRTRLDGGELSVEREAVHQGAGTGAQVLLRGLEVGTQGGDDHLGDLAHLRLAHATGGQRRGADPQAGGVHRRPLVKWDRVAVDGDPALVEPVLGRLTVEAGRGEVDEDEV